MRRPASGHARSASRAGATRRRLLAGVGGWPARSIAAPSPPGSLIDVLDRPAPTARRLAAAPMLRLALCGRRLVAVGERGIVLWSDDDGQRWQQAQVPVSVTLTGVQFTSPQRGFAIGHSAVVLRTDDAGRTWTHLIDGRQIPALLSPPAVAEQARVEGPDKPWLALHFTDDRNGRVVGAFGMALETSDGGQTWRSFADRLANPHALHLYAVHQSGDRVWIAGEQGWYAVSTDGGRQFVVRPTPYRGSFFAMCPLPDDAMLLGGLRGTLLLHAGDEQFRTLAPASTQAVIQLLATPSQGLVLLDQSGRLYTSGAARLSFRPAPVTPAGAWSGIALASDGGLVGASFDGVSRLQPGASPR